jgi:zinc protease
MVWTGVKVYSKDEPAGDVLRYILSDGRTARLYRSLVFDKKIASEVSAWNLTTRIGGYVSVDVVAAAGHTAEELEPATQAILDEIKRNGVTSAEVERAKRKIIAARLRQVERLGGFGGKADLLNEYEMFLHDPGYLPKDLANYRAVTPQAVQAFANKYLRDNQRVVLHVKPANTKPAAAR